MIAFLHGKIDQLSPTYCVLEVNGVGYWVSISLKTYTEIQKQSETKLYTQFIVREDAQLLFGFSEAEEKEFFNALISVNGVGPSYAMTMLSTLSIGEISNAIQSSNAKLLQSVKGIGTKTAQRIIIDLKDKIQKLEITDKSSVNLENKIKDEALQALEVLGISKKMSGKIIDKVIENNPEAPLEIIIKEVLKNIR